MEVLIIGAGIGGLTLGLMLHRAGIAARVFEAASELKAVGGGINILPHASRELCALGLAAALAQRAGADKVILGRRCTRVDYDGDEAIAHFEDVNGKPLPAQRGAVAVSCEGIHSVLRKQLYPNEGPPKYSGINMWRGITRWQPILTGASMIRIGWHHPAKLLIYPIRNNIDAQGRQLVNWVVDIETLQYQARDLSLIH